MNRLGLGLWGRGVQASVIVGPTVPEEGNARHWRVFMLTEYNGSGFATSLTQLDFLDDTDTVISTGGTPTASNAAFGAVGNAFDGSDGTFWASSSDTDSWIAYDFGSDVTVSKIRMKPRSGSNANQSPGYGFLQYSDNGTDWTDAWPFMADGGWSSLTERTFESPLVDYSAAQYWRITQLNSYVGTSATTSWTVAEIEMRATVGGADQTGTWTVTVDSSQPAQDPADIIDDDTATSHRSQNVSAARKFVAFDAGSAADVLEFTLTASSGNPTEMPEYYTLERSDDNSAWGVVKWGSLGASAFTALEERTVSLV